MIVILVDITTLSHAEEVVTILPGAHDQTRLRFLDIIFYPIEKGGELTWVNEDEILHKIIIKPLAQAKKEATPIVTSETIEPGKSFTYTFEKEGTYHFSSLTYPWINGSVFVNDRISSVTKTDSKNNIDVQLSWTPSLPKPGQETHFKIIFVDKKTEENQKHIDYGFSILDPTGKKIDLQSLHSGWGVESASYTFKKEGEFKPRISIFSVNFLPVEIRLTEFELLTSITNE
jgi:hypothetical protein